VSPLRHHSPHTSLHVSLQAHHDLREKGSSSLRYHFTSSRIIIVVASRLLVVSPALCPSWRRSLCLCSFPIRPLKRALHRPLGLRVNFVEKSSSGFWPPASYVRSRKALACLPPRVYVCVPRLGKWVIGITIALHGSGLDWSIISGTSKGSLAPLWLRFASLCLCTTSLVSGYPLHHPLHEKERRDCEKTYSAEMRQTKMCSLLL